MRTLAWTTLLLLLVVTSVSALLRLAQPRPDCGVWPTCRLNISQQVVSAHSAPADLSIVRNVHRAAASLALLSVLALTLLALTRRPRDWRYGGPSLALLTLALGLSILGIFTPGSPAIGVLLGNLLTGLVMVALAWRLARHGGTLHASTEHGRLAVWLLIGATLWLTQAALGGVSGTGRFATATIAHAVFALGIALTAYLIGARAYRTGLRRDGMALIALVFTQFVLGVVTAVFGAALYLVLLHNFVAVVGLALIVGLVGRSQYNRVEMTTGTS